MASIKKPTLCLYSTGGHSFIAILFMMLKYVSGYNMDTDSPISIKGNVEGSYFGFSADIHTEGSENMLIIGAPLDDINLDGVVHSGAIYKCPLTSPYTNVNCDMIQLDTAAGTSKNKSYQWLGATVRSAGRDGVIMSCAPYYKQILTSFIAISGKCFFLKNNFQEKTSRILCEPSDGDRADPFSQGTSCQAGMAGDLDEDGHFIIGGPGSFDHQGTLFIKTSEGIFQSKERGFNFDGSLQGYSVAYGTFSGPGAVDYVAGTPRAGSLFGMVFIYKIVKKRTIKKRKKIVLKEFKSLAGDQLGGYFGYSVAVADFNADGYDDIVVGAPTFSTSNQMNVGQICVFYQDEQRNLLSASKTKITGKATNGRFGFSLTAIGDINDDGVIDLAVGAPYDEDGAVFIYHGRSHGKLNTMQTQVLRPKSFGKSFNNFGYFIRGGRDADGNDYPDLIVGDYTVDSLLVVRTRPIIRPLIQISFDGDDLDLNEPTKGVNVTVDLMYEGKGTPDSYNFMIEINVDAEKQQKRVEMNDGNVSLIMNGVIYKSHMTQITFPITLKENVRNLPDPVVIQVTVEPSSETVLPPGEIAPVVDEEGRSAKNQILIGFDCITETCTPVFDLHVKSDRSLLYMGDTAELTFTITVNNSGNQPYLSVLHINKHASMRFSAQSTIKSQLAIICRDMTPLPKVVCDLGNPLPSSSSVLFNMTFSLNPVPGDSHALNIDFFADSTNIDPSMNTGNIKTVTIPLEAKIQVDLNGITNMPKLIYNETDEVLTTEIVHTYLVENRGPGTIENATLDVKWPMFTGEREYLLYLTNVELSNGEKCVIMDGSINPENLNITTQENNEEDPEEDEDEEEEQLEVRQRRHTDGDWSNKTTEEEDEELEKLPVAMAQSDTSMTRVINCSLGNSGCVLIRCSLGNIAKTEQLQLKITSHPWPETLLKVNTLSWDIVSSARLEVHSLPYVATPEEGLVETAMISFEAIPQTVKQQLRAPPWAIVISILVGLFILIWIIIILWKLGFFKRKKFDKDQPPPVQETEGDENGQCAEETKD